MLNLHVHSHFSTLDGLGTIEEIIERSKAIKSPAVCITDHASISSMPELFRKCNAAGIKPIIGCEFYFVNDVNAKEKHEKRTHLTVLAKNWDGVRSIMSQLGKANRQFHYRPRLSWEQCLDFKDCIIMTACAIGVLSLDDYEDKFTSLQKTYGDDFYLEIMPHVVDTEAGDKQKLVNERAKTLSLAYNAKVVATNDAHYVEKEDAHLHEVLLAIQSKKAWDDPKRWSFGGDSFYLRSVREMLEAFAENCPYLDSGFVKNSIITSVEIANKCNVNLPKFKVSLPSPYSGIDDEKIFGQKLKEGWNRKLTEDFPHYRERLLYEIGVIRKLGFVRYFLIVEDIIREARSRGIMVGPGRGSAAGSLVCYLLDITQLDPIEHGLFFERFLSPDRIDLPDIDVDFADHRRQEVFEYIREKYGRDKTANINTFSILSENTAFRDVAKVFGITPLQINELGKLIEDVDSFENVPELFNFAMTEKGKQIVDLAKRLSGRIRQNGVHAAGIIISSVPLEEAAVIEHRKEAEVINWDMRECEGFGLLKVDVLGLVTLSVLDTAKKLINDAHGVDIDFVKLPLDDPKSMSMFSVGETIGIFQFEGASMRSLLKSLNASDFDTLTAVTALFRPGPLNSGLTNRFVRISRDEEYETYAHEKLKPILGSTKGITIFQEQMMKIFAELAGFTYAEADKMRKIVGKKLGKDEFEKHRLHFIDGCKITSDVDESTANMIFSQLVEFAAYSFNKAHAAAYTMLSVWSMYLKAHYPYEFMAAQLTHVKSGDKLAILMRECSRMEIEVNRPDINVSSETYVVDYDGSSKKIFAPIRVIKGVGEKQAGEILRARNDGVFLSKENFVERVAKRTVNKGVVESLIKAGAFESLGLIEHDSDVRQQNYSEFLPTFNLLPSMSLGSKNIKEVKDLIDMELAKMNSCAESNKKSFICPKFAQKTSILVVNNPVKGEVDHFKSDGSKFFLTYMKSLGFSPGDFYYTSPIKCVHENYQTKVSTECQTSCLEFLKREIELVKPKLIICFVSGLAGFLVGDSKVHASKIRGQAVFSKAFGTYVVVSHSPQYAFFQESALESFKEAMAVVQNIFSE